MDPVTLEIITKGGTIAVCIFVIWMGFKREQYWIKFHNTFGEGGYNKTAGGRGFNGRTHSDETKEKLSDLNKGKFTGADNPFYGQHHTEEAKAKIQSQIDQNATGTPQNLEEQAISLIGTDIYYKLIKACSH